MLSREQRTAADKMAFSIAAGGGAATRGGAWGADWGLEALNRDNDVFY